MHIDRIDHNGNITQHKIHPTHAKRTVCGAKLGETQACAGNRPCGNCYPETRK